MTNHVAMWHQINPITLWIKFRARRETARDFSFPTLDVNPMTTALNKQSLNKPPRSRGRPKGSPNKTTGLLKDAILKAAAQAGGKEGVVGYLKAQAGANPGPFLGLLGKVLPTQITGEGDGPLQIAVVRFGAVLDVAAFGRNPERSPSHSEADLKSMEKPQGGE